MQNIIIHCKPSMLSTIKDSGLKYQEYFDEIDVTIPYTMEIDHVNNCIDDDEEFVNHFGLDYNQVNMIELV